MKQKYITTDLVIIGAGLTGLTLAYLLRQNGMSIKIVEARSRLGGRIFTKGYDKQQPVEMGATWLGSQHTKLISLLHELGLSTFDQKIGSTAIYEAISTSPHFLANLPSNPDPSKRLQGGSQQIIHTLASYIAQDDILLNQPVISISETNDAVDIITTDHTIQTKLVVSTLPPNLLTSSITITPALPAEIVQLTNATHTWMGESIKIVLSYAKPFWRAKHLSGTIMSNVGPIGEMYDHSNYEDSFYALKGFFSSNYYSISREERLAMIMTQLRKYFGDQATEYLSYEETVWRNEEYTFASYDSHVLPHQNNGHQAYQQSYMNGKLIIGGTETSTSYPGYMEGAVYNATSIAQRLLH